MRGADSTYEAIMSVWHIRKDLVEHLRYRIKEMQRAGMAQKDIADKLRMTESSLENFMRTQLANRSTLETLVGMAVNSGLRVDIDISKVTDY